MKYSSMLMLCIALCQSIDAANAFPELHRYTLTVSKAFSDKQLTYTSTADVMFFGPGYRATLNFLGRPSAIDVTQSTSVGQSGSKTTAFPEGIVSLLSAHANDVILNGGFSASDPGTPAGLLIINGSVISPLSFEHTLKGGGYQLNALVCFDSNGKLSFVHTASTADPSFRVLKNCSSALQVGPFVVDHGSNGIGRSEMWKTPFRRTLIGLDDAGALYAILFEKPINLFAVGEFLRAPRATGGHFSVGSSGAGEGDGLGLSGVVNLDGDQDSIGVFKGKVLTGDIYRKIPSAIVVQ